MASLNRGEMPEAGKADQGTTYPEFHVCKWCARPGGLKRFQAAGAAGVDPCSAPVAFVRSRAWRLLMPFKRYFVVGRVDLSAFYAESGWVQQPDQAKRSDTAKAACEWAEANVSGLWEVWAKTLQMSSQGIDI